ncbi:hypothetical protein BJ508DRAFT_305271 [Ascobolus immersus RN42]|uniref:Uncharacterized protein n=1 Tax=Ascobolus immersus RN42 TaxID=1160509 RepID=A0A3N4IE58_ASCIM|nr:hypothetical protein BJ508DRAFT_305271 [Ascobolus immersus RN42]
MSYQLQFSEYPRLIFYSHSQKQIEMTGVTNVLQPSSLSPETHSAIRNEPTKADRFGSGCSSGSQSPTPSISSHESTESTNAIAQQRRKDHSEVVIEQAVSDLKEITSKYGIHRETSAAKPIGSTEEGTGEKPKCKRCEEMEEDLTKVKEIERIIGTQLERADQIINKSEAEARGRRFSRFKHQASAEVIGPADNSDFLDTSSSEPSSDSE